jgi:hypothetical protein
MEKNFRRFFLFSVFKFQPRRGARLRRIFVFAFFLFNFSLLPLAFGGVPPLLNFQGRIVIGDVSYNGTGQFQFALVDGTGTNTFWSNDGTGAGGGEPSAAISLALTNGLYAVVLGDTNVSGMPQPIDPDTFTNADVRLRVWFNDGTHGFEQLSPDQRIVSAGYSLVAQTAKSLSGVISSAQLPGNVATTNYVNAATSGLATTGFVTSQGYVTAAVTNGLASTAYVNSLANGSMPVTWGTTASETSNSSPARIYFFVTNGQPVFGIMTINN